MGAALKGDRGQTTAAGGRRSGGKHAYSVGESLEELGRLAETAGLEVRGGA